MVHYLFVVMSDARSLYDIQRECARSQEISDWNVFWTLYDVWSNYAYRETRNLYLSSMFRLQFTRK